MSTWTPPRFDKFQFGGRRAKAVSASTEIAFSDFARMHVARRERVQERRLPTPKWAVNDKWLRILLVTYLEERFYIHERNPKDSLFRRLTAATRSAKRREPKKREDLKRFIQEYQHLTQFRMSDQTDDQVSYSYAKLRQEQLPIWTEGGFEFSGREWLTRKQLADYEVQIQNVDTDLVLTQKGHAEMIAAIVYLFYRLNWDSVTVAEYLHLKPPHIRQVLARLHATWTDSLAYKYEPKVVTQKVRSGRAEQDAAAHPQGAEGTKGSTSAPSPILVALFEGQP